MTFDVNLGGQYNLGKIKLIDNEEKTAAIFSSYLQPRFCFRAMQNFGGEIYSKWYFYQKLLDKEYFQKVDSYSSINFGMLLFYSLPTNTEKKIFFRFNYFYGIENTLSDFSQFQIGFKSNLSFKPE